MLKIDADTFHRWNMRVAQLATPESRHDVPERLVEACKTLVPADAGVINIFGETVSPRGVYDDIPPGFKVHHVVSYLDGAYLLDPYYRAGVDGVPSGLYSLRDVAPSEPPLGVQGRGMQLAVAQFVFPDDFASLRIHTDQLPGMRDLIHTVVH